MKRRKYEKSKKKEEKKGKADSRPPFPEAILVGQKFN
jgi:hypothetical protein